MKKILIVVSVCWMMCLSGCSMIGSNINSLKGSITGNTYECQFYSNEGEKFMTLKGKNIDITANVVKEATYDNDSGWGYTESMSSVLTLTVDGHQVESCGSTILFVEDGLTPDVDFKLESINDVGSYDEDGDIGDYAFIANIVNRWQNAFGKPVVVVIQSQLGDPICAFSGNKVYWNVCEDLPKTTKLMIDGKALYIHRANFQIVDKALLSK